MTRDELKEGYQKDINEYNTDKDYPDWLEMELIYKTNQCSQMAKDLGKAYGEIAELECKLEGDDN